MALILMFQRQTYHVQTTKIALLRPSASMDYAFVKETEWETAANAEVTSQVDKEERCTDAHRRVSDAQCCIASGRVIRGSEV